MERKLTEVDFPVDAEYTKCRFLYFVCAYSDGVLLWHSGSDGFLCIGPSTNHRAGGERDITRAEAIAIVKERGQFEESKPVESTDLTCSEAFAEIRRVCGEKSTVHVKEEHQIGDGVPLTVLRVAYVWLWSMQYNLKRIKAPTFRLLVEAVRKHVEPVGYKPLPTEPRPLPARVMVVCEICGNKRCPHAADTKLACTGSNEPGQPGSNYPVLRACQYVGDVACLDVAKWEVGDDSKPACTRHVGVMLTDGLPNLVTPIPV